MANDAAPVRSSARLRATLNPKPWARRFAGMCKLGFVTLVVLAIVLVFGGLGSGHEVALFWGTVALAAVATSAAELAQWLAWRLGPLARLALLALVVLIDVAELGAVAAATISALTG